MNLTRIFSILAFSMILVLTFGLTLGCSGGRPIPVDQSLQQDQINSQLKTHINTQLSPKLLKALKASDIILLGETHDHPHHHSVQAEIIRLIKPKSIAFEMLNEGQEKAIKELSTTPSKNWDQLLAWSQRGWPNFKLYQQVFRSSLKHTQFILPAHPHPHILHPLKLGMELDQALQTKLKLDHPLAPKQAEALQQEIIQAHCGHASPVLVKAMMSAQRLKDAWMAQVLIQAPKPVVLIVGRGHIQPKRGIPWAINLLAPQNNFKIFSLAMSPNQKDPMLQQTLQQTQGNLEQAQFSIPAHRNDDPCERFKEQLKGLKKVPHHKH